MASLIHVLKNTILQTLFLNQTRGLLNKERSGFGVSAFGISK
jgi:hypothetical protein